MAHDPNEFVLGDDVTDLVKRSPSPGLVVSARLDREDAKRLFALAKKTDRTPSQIAREALRRYLTDAERTPVFQGNVTIIPGGVWLANSKPMHITDSLERDYFQKVVEVKLPEGVRIMGYPAGFQKSSFASHA